MQTPSNPKRGSNPNNNWFPGRYIQEEFIRLNTKVDALDEKLDALIINHVRLEERFKMKSGIWGLIGGAMAVITAGGIWLLRSIIF